MAGTYETKVEHTEEVTADEVVPEAEQPMPSPEKQEAAIKKKYGGLLPKKPPLISKQDHERAYFDSADWALGKRGEPGQKPKTLIEKLRPKLQPTPQQPRPSRRASYETLRILKMEKKRLMKKKFSKMAYKCAKLTLRQLNV